MRNGAAIWSAHGRVLYHLHPTKSISIILLHTHIWWTCWWDCTVHRGTPPDSCHAPHVTILSGGEKSTWSCPHMHSLELFSMGCGESYSIVQFFPICYISLIPTEVPSRNQSRVSSTISSAMLAGTNWWWKLSVLRYIHFMELMDFAKIVLKVSWSYYVMSYGIYFEGGLFNWRVVFVGLLVCGGLKPPYSPICFMLQYPWKCFHVL